MAGVEFTRLAETRTHRFVVSDSYGPLSCGPISRESKGCILTSFSDLNLIKPLQQAVADRNYETPTPIQAQTIPAALLGKDVLGCAQTGTGKTAAFSLPILDHFGRQNQKSISGCPLALVLSPTRELAIQIGECLDGYGQHLKLRHTVIFGGVGQGKQVRAVSKGVHMLVATPGRLIDLMEQGHVNLDKLQVFVLDEADRMLDMGFMPQLRRIMAALPKKRQSLFFSATMAPTIIELAKKLLRNPVHVDVTPEVKSVELIEQRLRFVPKKLKRAVLKEILEAPDVGQALVFTRTKRGADFVAKDLGRAGIRAAVIHGNKSQNARQRALTSFREEKVRVLVATDVAARGLDIDGISHVVNYEMPVDTESYVHRIGRTGRAGSAGIAISLCAPLERPLLRSIEKLIGRKIPVEGYEPPAEEEVEKDTRPQHPYARRRGGAAGGRSGGGKRNRRRSAGTNQPKKKRPNKPKPKSGGISKKKKRIKTTEAGSQSESKAGSKRRVKRGSSSDGDSAPKTKQGNGKQGSNTKQGANAKQATSAKQGKRKRRFRGKPKSKQSKPGSDGRQG